MRIEEPSVVWVGPPEGKAYESLRSAILEHGMNITHCPSAEGLSEALAAHAHPVVVACDEDTHHRSRDVLASIEHASRRVPIFVLVEESDFSDYYYLMSHGVRCYYELREGPQRISEALCWAAMSSVA